MVVQQEAQMFLGASRLLVGLTHRLVLYPE
jgi:hypothetical protein